MKKLILGYLIFTIPLFIWSQQDPQYTQYIYNLSIINPAYTTSEVGDINLGAFHRTQWVGVEGAPKTNNIFGHAALRNAIDVGLSIVNDDIGGVIKENIFSADIAHKIPLEGTSNLSFGVKIGLNFFDTNFTNFVLESGDTATDPDFTNNVNKTFINFGTGVFYNTNKFYVGLSAPNILKSEHIDIYNGRYRGLGGLHLYLIGGYVFKINHLFKLKPSILGKALTKGAPYSFDANLNLLYNDKIEFGVGYRYEDAISAMANFKILKQFRVGYAYDHTLSNLDAYSSGSHEVFVLYHLNTLHNGYNKSPRYF